MRRCRMLLCLFALALTGWGAQPATKPAAASPAEQRLDAEAAAFFTGPIRTFEVAIEPKFLDELRGDRRRPVPATVRVGTNVFKRVGVHVKGAAGSTRSIDENPALTLNFDKFTPGQACFGLDKLHLNNSVQDRSLANEALASSLYLGAGVPTARATHAFVKLNGRDLGLYVLKEGYNRTFIRRNFPGNDRGNLYDGGFLRDIDQDLELDGGRGPTNWVDLRNLRRTLELPVADRRAQLDRVLDVDRFLTYMTLQLFTEDWDGYPRNRNNYRLYLDASGRATFIPHGMDQLFGNPHGTVRDGWGALVPSRVFELPELRERLRNRMQAMVTNQFRLEVLTNRLAQIQGRLAGALKQRPEEWREVEHNLDQLRRSVIERVAVVQEEIRNWPEPLPRLKSGTAVRLGEWRPMQQNGQAKFDRNPPEGDPTKSLHLAARARGTIASYRSSVRLPAGDYSFTGRARVKDVDPVEGNLGTGAGLRISGSTRSQKLEGTAGWTPLSFDFTLHDDGEAEFIIELRANRGEVWFDADSLKLTVR